MPKKPGGPKGRKPKLYEWPSDVSNHIYEMRKRYREHLLNDLHWELEKYMAEKARSDSLHAARFSKRETEVWDAILETADAWKNRGTAPTHYELDAANKAIEAEKEAKKNAQRTDAAKSNKQKIPAKPDLTNVLFLTPDDKQRT